MDPDSSGRLAEALGNLAVEMQAQSGSEATLRAIANGAVDLVPGCSWAGVSVIRGGKVQPAVPTDKVAEELDKLQTELGEGPAFTAVAEQSTIYISDLPAAGRWPKFIPTATRVGVHCLVSFPLTLDSGKLGSLNLYGASAGALTPESIAIGEILAQHASVALAGANTEEQMRSAIDSRDIIGQAKGILMQRDGLTGLQAFALLTRTSQETNVKLVEVAQWLVNEHEKDLPA